MICKAAALVPLLCAALGCISREPGTTVEISVASSAVSEPMAELVNDQGYHVELGSLYLVLARVELVRCATSPGAAAVLQELFGRSVAHAHGLSSPTAWAVPNVLAPLTDDGPIPLTVLNPPATDYCSVRLTLEAADSTAERMPGEVDMLGLSMYVAGSYRTDASNQAASFRYESHNSTMAELPLLDRDGRPAVLSLSEQNLKVTLRVELAYQRLLDGFTLLPGDYSPFSNLVLDSIFDHVTIVLLGDAG